MISIFKRLQVRFVRSLLLLLTVSLTPQPHKNSSNTRTLHTVLDPRFKGKQLTSGTINRPFGKFASLNTVPGEKYESDPYVKPSSGFEKFTPNDKGTSGFGSKDASKRAEFSDTLNVRVYREKLKSEQKYAAEFARKNLERLGKKEEDKKPEEAPESKKGGSLYSSIFENNDDEKILKCMKPKMHTHTINRGGWKTTAQAIGQYSHEANLNGIKFGRLNKMKDTYDHGHL